MSSRLGSHNRKKKIAKRNRPPAQPEPPELANAPHSFIFSRGTVSKNMELLTADLRKLMAPFTATKLHAKRSNSIKDFVAISGKLHVSHLVMTAQTNNVQTLRIVKLPAGPSVHFTIHKFSLMNDVLNFVKGSTMTGDKIFARQPLVALDNFSTGSTPHHSITSRMLQNLFPALDVSRMTSRDVRRCVIFSYDSQTDLIEFRQYRVKVMRPDLTRTVRKIVEDKVPKLSNYRDVSDYVLKTGGGGFSSGGSDAEGGGGGLAVPLSAGEQSGGALVEDGGATEDGGRKKVLKPAKERRSVRLIEIGPRLTLQLYKIEAGILEGEVLYHSRIEKTPEERCRLAELTAHRKSKHMFFQRFNPDGTELTPHIPGKKKKKKKKKDEQKAPGENRRARKAAKRKAKLEAKYGKLPAAADSEKTEPSKRPLKRLKQEMKSASSAKRTKRS